MAYTLAMARAFFFFLMPLWALALQLPGTSLTMSNTSKSRYDSMLVQANTDKTLPFTDIQDVIALLKMAAGDPDAVLEGVRDTSPVVQTMVEALEQMLAGFLQIAGDSPSVVMAALTAVPGAKEAFMVLVNAAKDLTTTIVAAKQSGNDPEELIECVLDMYGLTAPEAIIAVKKYLLEAATMDVVGKIEHVAALLSEASDALMHAIDHCCVVVEDPHITVFDGAQVSLNRATVGVPEAGDDADGPGIKWLVQSGLVHIQARYLPDPTIAEQNMFVEAVAVGGPFLKNNTLVVGSLDHEVTWNGEPILTSFPSEFKFGELVRARRHNESRVVQDFAQVSPGIDLKFPLGVKLTVNRFQHHVNVAIKMPHSLEEQDGLCGNFNGDASDDFLDVAALRQDPAVLPSDSLFANAE